MIVLLVLTQLARADDDVKTQSRSSGRPAASAPTSNSVPAPKPPSTNRHTVNPSNNRSVQPVSPNARPTIAPRTFPTITRNRPTTPSNLPVAQRTPGRSQTATPNTRPNTVSKTPSNRIRIPSRTGNELSFSQAQAQNSRHHHDRDWWRHHHSRVCFYGGGYWFWNAGWWFPAWGYSPYYNNYLYDGPIYGYGEMSPGDVTAQVQEALARLGYYYGPIDGVLGPETRDAILRFQSDNGLAATAAIDEPTLDTLGLT
jgi:Putative peptidoglycan binding domain